MGLHQEFILGPILYVDNLPLMITYAFVTSYANNTNLLFSGKDNNILQNKICTSLNSFSVRSSDACLLFNISKTKYVKFHKNNNVPNSSPYK